MPSRSRAVRRDPIDLIAQVNAGRVPVLLQHKFGAMAQDAFAFLRATAMLGHRAIDLAALPAAPLGWVCGDLHLQNFGCFRGGNRLVYFDLNDFDEAARLPVCIDLLRLLASIHTAGPGLGLDRAQCHDLVREALAAYAHALVRAKAFWLERETATGPIAELLGQVARRKRRTLLAGRTRVTDGRRHFVVDGKRYLPVAETDPIRDLLAQGLEQLARCYDDPQFFRPLDFAFRVAGMGSLGVPRYVALVQGKGDPDRNAIIDFKWAAGSSAAGALEQFAQPEWSSQAARVVAVQDVCQAASPAFLSSVDLGGQSFVARALQPVEDRVQLPRLARSARHLSNTLQAMAHLSAYAQLRSAGRSGAAGVDALLEFGKEIEARPQPWLDAARAIDAANTRAFKAFQRAWSGADPRLHRLCAVEAAPNKPVAPRRALRGGAAVARQGAARGTRARVA